MIKTAVAERVMLNAILDKLPPDLTMFFGGLYVIMPILPEPHLVQKAMMLAEGVPLLPIDWFDIVAHSSGGALAVLMWRRQRQLRAQARVQAHAQAQDKADPSETSNKTD